MLLWSVVDASVVFDTGEVPSTQREVAVAGVRMLVTPQENGMARVDRLISPNALDYLKPEWQPGSLVALSGISPV